MNNYKDIIKDIIDYEIKQKNKNSFVSEYAEHIKKIMQNRKTDVAKQKCIIQKFIV